MSKKSAKIADQIRHLQGRGTNPHYLGYFDCFNRQLFYEAHDVLEELWLEDRNGPDGDFFKGLIQLAGAFVHVQKKRSGPAVSLLCLAENNLRKYPARHRQLDLEKVLELIGAWRSTLEGRRGTLEILQNPPQLSLINQS